MPKMKSLVLSFATLLVTGAAWGGPLKEGSYKGISSFQSFASKNIRTDVMALLLKADKENPENFYGVLAEYTRIPLGPVGSALRGFKGGRLTVNDRIKVTKWVPRMYAYYVEKVTSTSYELRTLDVTPEGEIVVSEEKMNATLQLDPQNATTNPLNGATLVRPGQEQSEEEVIQFGLDPLGSTWEDLVTGDFFWSHASSGVDYVIKKPVNSRIEKDPVTGQARAILKSQKPVVDPKTGEVSEVSIQGWYSVNEKVPGLYTLKALRTDNEGNEHVERRIGLFIDIVNWKDLGAPKYTTEEFMLINPNDPNDVGFFYERH